MEITLGRVDEDRQRILEKSRKRAESREQRAESRGKQNRGWTWRDDGSTVPFRAVRTSQVTGDRNCTKSHILSQVPMTLYEIMIFWVHNVTNNFSEQLFLLFSNVHIHFFPHPWSLVQPLPPDAFSFPFPTVVPYPLDSYPSCHQKVWNYTVSLHIELAYCYA